MTTDFKPRLSEPWPTPDFRERHEKALADAIAKHHIACEELTERQLAEVMKQALTCGDIQKLVVTMPAGTLQQGVVYIPFARQQELESEIKRLTDILDKAGIEWRKSKLEYECTL